MRVRGAVLAGPDHESAMASGHYLRAGSFAAHSAVVEPAVMCAVPGPMMMIVVVRPGEVDPLKTASPGIGAGVKQTGRWRCGREC